MPSTAKHYSNIKKKWYKSTINHPNAFENKIEFGHADWIPVFRKDDLYENCGYPRYPKFNYRFRDFEEILACDTTYTFKVTWHHFLQRSWIKTVEWQMKEKVEDEQPPPYTSKWWQLFQKCSI